ncbi:putative ankyrin repeat protein RF_0381 [Artemia franciscana]|uniref:putative ankyrin repeat protein RF_0381 n=1 Tax=Artemia franciscana TaxID=6661 RepID=UPI0032D9C11B
MSFGKVLSATRYPDEEIWLDGRKQIDHAAVEGNLLEKGSNANLKTEPVARKAQSQYINLNDNAQEHYHLEKEVNLNHESRESCSLTPLDHAAVEGNLLEKGSNANLKTEPVARKAQSQYINLNDNAQEHYHLEKGVNLNFESRESCSLTPLDHAAVEGNLLEKGSNANLKTEPVARKAQSQYINLNDNAQEYYHLEKEVNLNHESRESCSLTPLDHAAVEGNLLEKGSNANLKTEPEARKAQSQYLNFNDNAQEHYHLEKEVNLNFESRESCSLTPLDHAAVKGNLSEKGSNANLKTEPEARKVQSQYLNLNDNAQEHYHLEKEVNLNFESRESCSLTPLDHATVEGNLSEKGSNANLKSDNWDDRRKISLHYAAVEGKGDTPLHMAVKNGHTSVVYYLLEKGSNPNFRAENWEDHGKTPLHFAAEEGKQDICHLLLSKGANINLLDYKCYTPLHFAAEEGKLDICQLLVSKGALINSPYSPLTPLHLAAKKGHMSVAEYLLKKGANPHLRAANWSNGGKTPLHFAAAEGKLDICQLLVSKGVHIDILDNNNVTPLHWTAKNGHISVACYLLEKGSNPNLRAENWEDHGKTPLHFAAAKGTLAICQLLVSKGAHIDAIDNKRLTPLHWAAKRGQISVANYLLEKGANLNLKSDENGLKLTSL